MSWQETLLIMLRYICACDSIRKKKLYVLVKGKRTMRERRLSGNYDDLQGCYFLMVAVAVASSRRVDAAGCWQCKSNGSISHIYVEIALLLYISYVMCVRWRQSERKWKHFPTDSHHYCYYYWRRKHIEIGCKRSGYLHRTQILWKIAGFNPLLYILSLQV